MHKKTFATWNPKIKLGIKGPFFISFHILLQMYNVQCTQRT